MLARGAKSLTRFSPSECNLELGLANEIGTQPIITHPYYSFVLLTLLATIIAIITLKRSRLWCDHL